MPPKSEKIGKLWTDVYPSRIAPFLMILYSFWSSWPDLSFETYFVFFDFFQKSLQKYFRGARIVNCFFRSGPDRQFFCFRGARIANFYFRGARIANFFALFVSRVSKILVFRFVSFVSFVSFRLFRIESLDFFCVNFLYGHLYFVS